MPKAHFDWFTAATLWLGAAVLAIRSGNLPLMMGAPSWLAAHWWDYVPLVLITVYLLMALYRQLRQKVIEDSEAGQSSQAPLIEKSNEHFTNCEVVLDGHAYRNCTFNNVTFVYSGGPYALEHNRIGAAHIVKAGDEKTSNFANLLMTLGFIKYPMYTAQGPVTQDEWDARNHTRRDP